MWPLGLVLLKDGRGICNMRNGLTARSACAVTSIVTKGPLLHRVNTIVFFKCFFCLCVSRLQFYIYIYIFFLTSLNGEKL